jgi:protein phosphatase 1 regulatory subunit 37
LEQNESDIVVRAWTCLTELSSSLSDVKGSPQTPKPIPNPAAFNELVAKSKAVASELAIVIQETEDPSRLEELLGINDQLLSLLKNVPGGTRPQLTLKGLGLTLEDSRTSSVDGDGMLDGLPHINGRAATVAINGHGGGDSSASSSADSFEEGQASTPTTPRIDKGKQRAEPEPEREEMVLSPKTFQISESESEDEDGVRYHEEVASPTDR